MAKVFPYPTDLPPGSQAFVREVIARLEGLESKTRSDDSARRAAESSLAATAQAAANIKITADTAKESAESANAKASTAMFAAENRVSDPSMTGGQWIAIDGWYVAFGEGEGRTDAYSLTLEETTDVAIIPVTRNINDGTVLDIPVSEGDTWEFGGWYRTSDAWDGTGKLSLQKQNVFVEEGEPPVDLEIDFINISTIHTDWTFVSKRYTIPNGITSIKLLLYGDNEAGQVWWDDLYLKNVTAVVYAEQQAETAQTTATTAQSTANAAQSTANTAQTTAETAQTTAEDAQDTAEAAQTTANTAASTASAAQTAADLAATAAADALAEAEAAQTAAGNAQSAASAAQSDADTAQTTANAAQTAASAAASAASAAQTTADNAQSAADDAANDAAIAAGIANSKGKVIIQSSAPDTADRLPQNLWIDTTGGANTPKRWNGSSWVAVTDKAATDAANAAVAAQSAADAAQGTADSAATAASAAQSAASAAATAASNAQDRADEAFDEAVAAATAAGNAQTSADSKNRVWYQNDPPAGTGHNAGDTWFDTNDGNRVYRWNGSWTAAQFGTNALVDSAINSAKIATGAVLEAKIADTAVATAKLKDSAVTETKIANLAVGSAKVADAAIVEAKIGNLAVSTGKIKDAAIVEAKINDLAVTSAKIADLAVTNGKIADATIQNAKIANLDAAKITTGTLNAARIGANSIEATKILLAGSNMVPNPDFDVITGWTAVGATPVVTNVTRGRGVYLPRTSSDDERTLTSSEFRVSGGETTYAVSATVLAQSATGAEEIRIEVIPVSTSGAEGTPVPIAASAPDGSWRTIRGQYEVPDGTNIRGLKFRFVGGATTATTGNDYLVQPRIMEATVGEMIVDGAITSRVLNAEEIWASEAWLDVLNAGVITTDMVTSDFGENLDISSSGSITLISGQVTDLQTGVTGLTSTVNGIGEIADEAHDLAQAADEKAEDLALTLQVTPEHVKISRPESSSAVVIDDESLTIVVGGVESSTWNGGIMQVGEIDVDKARIARVTMEEYENPSTLIKSTVFKVVSD